MALSKKFAKMRSDRRAEMGVGTMIIFIAMVLVAAVAASVLISTANTVREQATQTGNDAINNVASGFDIKYVKGTVSSNIVNKLDIYVQLSAGSPAIRMDTVTLSVTNGSADGSGELIFDVVTKAAGAGTPAKYGATLVPPAGDDTPFKSYGTVSQGDLVKITVTHIDSNALALRPGDAVTVKIMPAKGSATTVSFTVPPVLSDGVVNLR